MNWKNGLLGCVLAISQTVFAQGSLTPPGAPAPTMKTLAQIEPRTPISSLPYTISQSGSYYLTTNLSSTGHGVVITTHDVALDLRGFTLRGDRDGGDSGIFLNGATNNPIRNVLVRNGTVREFSHGVLAEYSQNCRFEHLVSEGNLQNGIYLYGWFGGQCGGNTIERCTLSGNSYHGIALSAWQGRCNGNTIASCMISDNSYSGIYLYSDASGECAGNTIVNCTIRDNEREGLHLNYADGNRLEGNHIITSTTNYGIYCNLTEKNLIVRNSCVGQTNHFRMTANDTYGPIVTNKGSLSETDPWANFSR